MKQRCSQYKDKNGKTLSFGLYPTKKEEIKVESMWKSMVCITVNLIQ